MDSIIFFIFFVLYLQFLKIIIIKINLILIFLYESRHFKIIFFAIN